MSDSQGRYKGGNTGHGLPERAHWPVWLQHTATFGTIAVVSLMLIYVGLPLTGLAAHNFWKLFMYGWGLTS